MQWAFFRVPVAGGAPAEELNRFLRSVRVLVAHREFVCQGDASFWAMAVEYFASDAAASSAPAPRREGERRVDYKALLSPEDFSLFVRLREWRKARAEAEATPVYTICTNEQLAEIARRRCSSLAALGEIEGIGQGRLDKYGQALLAVLAGAAPPPVGDAHDPS